MPYVLEKPDDWAAIRNDIYQGCRLVEDFNTLSDIDNLVLVWRKYQQHSIRQQSSDQKYRNLRLAADYGAAVNVLVTQLHKNITWNLISS